MANEIRYPGIGDLRVAEMMSGEYIRLAAAREALPNHPALWYAGDTAGKLTTTVKVGHVGLDGFDMLSSRAEDAEGANTALTDGSTTVTVAPFFKSYAASDLARLTGADGILDATRFAMDAVVTVGQKIVDLVANITDSFSATVGSTGVNATLADHLSAKAILEIANVPGPYLAVYHPRQWNDIIQDAYLNSGGAVQFDPATPALVRQLGNGFKGTLAGVQVFTTTRVPTANSGADRAGGMFGRGAVVWADASIPVDDPSNQISLGKALFERDRNARKGETAWITHYYCGASMAIDDFGVSIITDA